MVRWLCFSTCVSLALHATAAPTWPSAMDELEDIMFLNTGYRARGFATEVTPCSFSSKGPGRITAAEWIRTAFHDMIAGTVSSTAGGMDASIMYETKALENIGTAFNSSLLNFAPFFSSRASMADLIAMGMYTAVRSCGGPVVPIRTGRIDATRSGATAFVPQPQNSVGTFQNQFNRVGFNLSDIIAVTACGHTTGGVHAAFFPEIVPAGTAPDDYAQFDNTAAFDTKVATDFLADKSIDPMVVGPSTKNTRDSDRRLFIADNNVTITSLADPATFQTVCARVLQKLIDVVPSSVKLTDPITPYEAKPVGLQLRLLDGGSALAFTGEIRVRTTTRAAAQISKIQLIYKDRAGGNACGSCTIDGATEKGRANGFDDSFSFFSFSSQLPVTSSISSFNVVITRTDGQQEVLDNNGIGYPIQDTVILQVPQSCVKDGLSADKKNLTIVAAVRDSTASVPVNTSLIFKVARKNVPIDIPALSVESYTMNKQNTIGVYSLYALSYALNTSQALNTVFNVSSGAGTARLADSFKLISDLPSDCVPLQNAGGPGGSINTSSTAPTSSISPSSDAPSSSWTTSTNSWSASSLDSASSNTIASSTLTTGTLVTSVVSGSLSSSAPSPGSSSIPLVSSLSSSSTPSESSSPSVASLSSSTISSTSTPTLTPTFPASYHGCYVDSVSPRAMTGRATNDESTLTIESCASFCSDYAFYGLEYTYQCFCGNSLPDTRSTEDGCNMPCSGSANETCGGPDRLSVYQNTAYITPGNPSIDGYVYKSCYVDMRDARVLGPDTTSDDTGLTVQECKNYCAGSKYFGTEYGQECWCGDELGPSSTVATESDCSMQCAGDKTQLCGAGDRLSLYERVGS